MARTTRWLSGSAPGNSLESARLVRTVGTVVSGLQIQDAISPLDEDLVRVFKPCRHRLSARSQVVGISGHNLATEKR
jgi:hypothetical protein